MAKPLEKPSGSSPSGGTTYKASPISSKTDWLGNSLLTAKIVTAAAECVPFPYIKGVFGTVVVLLETVQKVTKNRDSMKELCESTVEIITILKEHIVADGESFQRECEELESLLQEILIVLQPLTAKPRGVSAHVKELLKSTRKADAISGYRQKIRDLRSNLILKAVLPRPSQSPLPKPVRNRSVNNCPSASRLFQGRTTILNQMCQYFSSHSETRNIFLLHGLGGSGKTQIALKFIEESAARFSDIFMVDTSSVDTIESAFKNIVCSRNSGSTSQGALKWLASKQDNWLLFFDNADDPKINLNKFFPQGKHGNILITSRNPGLRVYAGSHSLVSDMEETDAVKLLLRSAAEEESDENQNIAAEIVKTLYYLPLAIIQAGGFISESGALGSYLELYATNKAKLLSERPAQSHDDYAWTVYTTWQISFEQLSKPAAMLLRLCSCLHHQGISEDIFKNASQYEFKSPGPTKEDLQEPLQFLSRFLGPTGIWDCLHFMETTNELRAYSLINFSAQTKQFSIHPLVHSWTQSVLIQQESFHSWMYAILGMAIKGISDLDIVPASLKLLPHIDSTLLGNVSAKDDFHAEYGRVYHYACRLKDALKLHLAVFEKRKTFLGNEHPYTMNAMAILAGTHYELGQFEEAEELQVEVLEKRRNILGVDHLDTLNAMGDLASTYHQIGLFKEAEELKLVVLEKITRIVGEDHPDTLHAVGSLASTRHELGQFRDAEKLNIVVLEKCTKILGEDHLDTLFAMANLAYTYHELGLLKKAEGLEVVVLEKRTEILGEDHLGTLYAMDNLACTYRSLGRLKEAEELHLVVLQKRMKILGENHPDTVSVMSDLLATYRALGKVAESGELENLMRMTFSNSSDSITFGVDRGEGTANMRKQPGKPSRREVNVYQHRATPSQQRGMVLKWIGDYKVSGVAHRMYYHALYPRKTREYRHNRRGTFEGRPCGKGRTYPGEPDVETPGRQGCGKDDREPSAPVLVLRSTYPPPLSIVLWTSAMKVHPVFSGVQ
ncbi:hypothetical protein C8R43DRAFT_1079913 [Mycena crocata]|nr:hypothetical protein C8R43DRAFT_1079913 [Mycena crocata]